MGLYEILFPKKAVDDVTTGYFKTLTAYQPVFHSYGGGLYEADLCRAAIHTFATHCSKLKPTVSGARRDLQKVLEFQPNPFMDTTKFLYKVATILETECTVFIAPIWDQYFEKIVGFYPVQPSKAEVREDRFGNPWIAFRFADGRKSAERFENVGIMNKFFYQKDFFGDTNSPIRPVLDLMKTQRQGLEEGVKQSATIRFLAKMANTLKSADIEAERQRWNQTNLSLENQGGVAIFDAKYTDVKQIDSKPYIIDSDQMEAVNKSVYKYFNTNEDILENNFTPDKWASYYEAKIEPFAIQLSLVMTNMLFTNEQKVRGNQITFSSNRLQYASINEKLAVVQQLSDRGMMSRNEGREVFNMEPIEGGDDYIIRGEYYNASEKVN